MTIASKQHDATMLEFAATLYDINDTTVLRLPDAESKALSSRGQVAVNCTLNGHNIGVIVLEPDGDWGHWIKITDEMKQKYDIKNGDTISLNIVQTKVWPEPTIPEDFKKELSAAPENIQGLWKDITAMARWEWVRWVNATNNPSTRARRVEVSISKMKAGKRRPCCFNLAACTDPSLTKNGKLINI